MSTAPVAVFSEPEASATAGTRLAEQPGPQPLPPLSVYTQKTRAAPPTACGFAPFTAPPQTAQFTSIRLLNVRSSTASSAALVANCLQKKVVVRPVSVT